MTPFNAHIPQVAKQIVEHSTTAMFLLDDELHVQHINPSAEILVQLSARAAFGISIKELFGHSPSLIDTIKQAQQSGEVCNAWDFDFVNVTNVDEHEKVDYAIVPIAFDEHEPLMLVQIHRHPHVLSIGQNDSLEQQHEVSRQLIRGLAHEIKNPLGGIRGAAQLLERELPNAALKEYTDVIIAEADRLRALVDRLLGPVKHVEKTAQSIHIAIERVRQIAQADITNSGYDIHIIRDYDPSIPDLPYDVELLIQAILNIVRNAVQALDDAKVSDGMITLKTRTERHRMINTKLNRLCVRIDIIDNGLGIPDELQQQIFYPMVTNKADGTGLGLSIAQSLIVQHEGNIECVSKPGDTRFTILLPME